jgi:hypothetical protein
MGTTGRVALGVIAGAVLWAVLWVGGTAAARAALPELLDPTQRLDHAGALLGLIVYSVVLSVAAGYVAAAVAATSAMRAVWILAVLQLAIGVAVEISYWELMPVWYHLAFLALLVPATVYGGRLKAG